MTDAIVIHPDQAAATGGAIAQKSGAVSTIGSTIDTATRSLIGELNGAQLGHFPSAVDVLHRRVQISLMCAEENLQALGNGLKTASSEFAHLDANVAALIANLENATPEFVGYEPPGVKVQKKGRSWWQKGLLIGGGILATVGGAFIATGGAIGEIPSGGLDTPVTIGGGALTAAGIADFAEVGSEDLLFTIAGEGGAAATASTLEGALNDIVAQESTALDQELENFFHNPANTPAFTGSH
jgi:uncharacterized protein YukE